MAPVVASSPCARAQGGAKTGHALAEAGIHWLEDPIASENVTGYARLSQQLRVPIATGEHLYTASEFARLFEARGTGVALIDLGRIGGITPWHRFTCDA